MAEDARTHTPARVSLATVLQTGMATLSLLSAVVAVGYGYGALNTKMDESLKATQKVDKRIVEIMKSQPILSTEISLLQLRANLIEAKIITLEKTLSKIQSALASESTRSHSIELRVLKIERINKGP